MQKPGKVGVPVLIVANSGDKCSASPPDDAPRVAAALAGLSRNVLIIVQSNALEGQWCAREVATRLLRDRGGDGGADQGLRSAVRVDNRWWQTRRRTGQSEERFGNTGRATDMTPIAMVSTRCQQFSFFPRRSRRIGSVPCAASRKKAREDPGFLLERARGVEPPTPTLARLWIVAKKSVYPKGLQQFLVGWCHSGVRQAS
jgi:hypothetical protein